MKNQESGLFFNGDWIPITSGSSHSPGTMPFDRMRSSTYFSPPGVQRVLDGCHNPTDPHQSSFNSAYQPASITKYSQPASAAASMRGSSFSVVGSPSRQFM